MIEEEAIPYSPDHRCDKAHPFDRLFSFGKKRILIAEMKSKRRRLCHEDTGINIKHYEDYKFIMDEKNLDVIMFFLDHFIGSIYGEKLLYLDQPIIVNGKSYPLKQGDQIYFPLKEMLIFRKLNPEEILELGKLTKNNDKYDYSQCKPFYNFKKILKQGEFKEWLISNNKKTFIEDNKFNKKIKEINKNVLRFQTLRLS